MKILVKFPSRSRPKKLLDCLDNIKALSTHNDVQILITADLDDPTMFNPELRDAVNTYENASILYGTRGSKVAAINADMEFYNDWDILINMSDDMEFIKPGFDSQIVKDFEIQNSLDILLHYPDQAAGKALITMAIMGKKYYDRFGYIYHPAYKSLFCDNEQHLVAQKLGRYVYNKKRLFNHNHPAWGHGTPDALMRHTESFHKEDKATFEYRKSINFEL